MRITNGYIVDITYDGMHESRLTTTHVFTGDEALEEVKNVVKEVLAENNELKEHWCSIDDKYVPISEILANNELLEEFINWGGTDVGRLDITILRF